jgi:hypothetical protein
MQRYGAVMLAVGMMGTGLLMGQAQAPAAPTAAPPSEPYQPKFPGDPARSESEAQALGYMRTVLRAQHAYKKRHNKYAESLEALAGTGSFTKRMAHSTDRGDYTATFRPHFGSHVGPHSGPHVGPHDDGFVLTMTPKQMDSQHRSFYAEDDGAIHGDDQKAADLDSPKVK